MTNERIVGLPIHKKKEIVDMVNNGVTQAATGRYFRVSATTVGRILAEYNRYGKKFKNQVAKVPENPSDLDACKAGLTGEMVINTTERDYTDTVLYKSTFNAFTALYPTLSLNTELNKIPEIRSVEVIVNSAFVWSETPQGRDFWRAIANFSPATEYKETKTSDFTSTALYNRTKDAFQEAHPTLSLIAELSNVIDSGVRVDPAGTLSTAFNWSESLQGDAFWRAVHTALNTPKVDVPEPAEASGSKYVITPTNVVVYHNGEEYAADMTCSKFSEAVAALLDGDYERAIKAISVKDMINAYEFGPVRVEDGKVMYEGHEINNRLTREIIQSCIDNDEAAVAKLVKFFNNLMENPSNRAVTELFGFLEATDIKLTDDGHFIAWKKVKSNFKDIYTGKMDNSPGRVVAVPRNQVDEDSDRTCSHGLHVAAFSYMAHYGSSAESKIVSCKVHPRDVVAVPADYNNAKMRVCRYEVVGEYLG